MRDVIVVGGGPAGTACATTVADAGLSVELWTAQPSKRMRSVEGLPPGGEQLVRDVFGERAFHPRDHRRALANRSAWGSAQLERSEFMFNPLGEGWHVERVRFDAALLDAARKAGVAIRRKRVDDAQEPRARWIVDATGRNARIARAFGATRVRRDQLVALLWHEDDRDRADATTTIEAVEYGWWYTMPGGGDRRLVALMTDADLLPPASERRGAVVTDASTSHLDRIVDDGWLAVGDAAITFDPLSSQGMVSAITMGREAAKAIVGNHFAAYIEQYRQLLRRHEADKAAYYALEQRWPEAPFWARRVQPASSAQVA